MIRQNLPSYTRTCEQSVSAPADEGCGDVHVGAGVGANRRRKSGRQSGRGRRRWRARHSIKCISYDETLPGRLELPTLRLTASRSNQLSYGSL